PKVRIAAAQSNCFGIKLDKARQSRTGRLTEETAKIGIGSYQHSPWSQCSSKLRDCGARVRQMGQQESCMYQVKVSLQFSRTDVAMSEFNILELLLRRLVPRHIQLDFVHVYGHHPSFGPN